MLSSQYILWMRKYRIFIKIKLLIITKTKSSF